MNSSSNKKPKVSIGIPVYNGEMFLRKRFDSILAQTFTDYEVIISDNTSTDSTSQICKEYSDKDKRFQYIRQPKNIGMMPNFYFLVNKANCEYFVWAAVDDLWEPEFLEKNVKVLDFDKKVIGSISKFEIYNNEEDLFKKEKEFLKKIGLSYRPHGTSSIKGSYEERVRTCLKKFPYQSFYSVFHTKELRASIFKEHFVTDNFAVVLNLLKYGEIHELDEVLFHVSSKGTSSKGIFYVARLFNKNFLGWIFPHYPLTVWCLRNLGLKLFLRNLDCFFRLNLDAVFLLFVDITKWFKIQLSRRK